MVDSTQRFNINRILDIGLQRKSTENVSVFFSFLEVRLVPFLRKIKWFYLKEGSEWHEYLKSIVKNKMHKWR